MFNYESLSDVEFEALAQDVMSKKLGVELRRFAKGRDGGVDLTNDADKKEIIVQVKHYYRSTIASLISSLKKEIVNVIENNPKQYYVVTSATLSVDKKAEIFQMFQAYMNDVNDVVTREDIEDLLQSERYIEIVKKHYKLWLHSTQVLELIYSGDIETDSQVCLKDIRENERILVQTHAYFEALKCLDSSSVLFVTGVPGIGKTITTQMIVLKYVSEGYKLRYSTDTTDLNALKKTVFSNHNSPEVILLDDCFGQYYFDMKQTQGSELVSLIKHVKISQHKVLILNSRLTILNEAKTISTEITRCIDSKDLRIHVIDMDMISILDRAKILYNHLFFSNIPTEYFDAVKAGRFYMSIINHKNYSPRIIEHITKEKHFSSVQATEYPKFILDVLNKPDEIWDNEYSKRIQQIDRIFLGTLFSLTNTLVEEGIFRECFNYRLSLSAGVDLTEDNYLNCLSRLNMSMVKIVDDHGRRKIGVINPSVNDYIRNRLNRNRLEKEEIINSIISVKQAEKMLVDSNSFFKARLLDKAIFNMYFATERNKRDFIVAKVTELQILDEVYIEYIHEYIQDIRLLLDSEKLLYSSTIEMLKLIILQRFYDFYSISVLFNMDNTLAKILLSFNLDELIDAISLLFQKFYDDNEQELIEKLEEVCDSAINSAVSNYGYFINIAEEVESYNIQQIIDSCSKTDDELGESECDAEEATDALRERLLEDITQRVLDKLDALPDTIKPFVQESWDIQFFDSDIEDVIQAALLPDIDDEEFHGPSEDAMIDEIDYMFQR